MTSNYKLKSDGDIELIYNNNLVSLEGCPDYCYVLSVRECKNLKSAKGMPQNIENWVDFEGTGLESLEGFPPTLRTWLDLSETNLTNLNGDLKKCNQLIMKNMRDDFTLEGCPEIKKILISNTGRVIENFKGLHPECEAVAIQGETRIKSFEGLPSTLRILDLDSSIVNEDSIEYFPKKIQNFIMPLYLEVGGQRFKKEENPNYMMDFFNNISDITNVKVW